MEMEQKGCEHEQQLLQIQALERSFLFIFVYVDLLSFAKRVATVTAHL